MFDERLAGIAERLTGLFDVVCRGESAGALGDRGDFRLAGFFRDLAGLACQFLGLGLGGLEVVRRRCLLNRVIILQHDLNGSRIGERAGSERFPDGLGRSGLVREGSVESDRRGAFGTCNLSVLGRQLADAHAARGHRFKTGNRLGVLRLNSRHGTVRAGFDAGDDRRDGLAARLPVAAQLCLALIK